MWHKIQVKNQDSSLEQSPGEGKHYSRVMPFNEDTLRRRRSTSRQRCPKDGQKAFSERRTRKSPNSFIINHDKSRNNYEDPTSRVRFDSIGLKGDKQEEDKPEDFSKSVPFLNIFKADEGHSNVQIDQSPTKSQHQSTGVSALKEKINFLKQQIQRERTRNMEMMQTLELRLRRAMEANLTYEKKVGEFAQRFRLMKSVVEDELKRYADDISNVLSQLFRTLKITLEEDSTSKQARTNSNLGAKHPQNYQQQTYVDVQKKVINIIQAVKKMKRTLNPIVRTLSRSKPPVPLPYASVLDTHQQ